jgi:hypothetical protein
MKLVHWLVACNVNYSLYPKLLVILVFLDTFFMYLVMSKCITKIMYLEKSSRRGRVDQKIYKKTMQIRTREQLPFSLVFYRFHVIKNCNFL